MAHPWRLNLWHLALLLSHFRTHHAILGRSLRSTEPATAVISDLFGDDSLRREVRGRLVKRELFAAMGISSIRRGTGRPCVVCARSIVSPTLEREVEAPGVVAFAHPDCYKIWREESAILKRRPAV